MKHEIPAGLSRKEAELYSQLDPARLPRHVAIIMDGNGRWANRRHLPRVAGHKKGMDVVHEIVVSSARIGLPYVTLFAFSTENWRRPKLEVGFLMRLLRTYLRMEMPTMKELGVRLQIVGRRDQLSDMVLKSMEWALNETAGHTGTTLTLAFNYSGRAEMVDAMKSLVAEAEAAGGLDKLELDEAAVARHLYTSHMPDPDLVIRTSGEMRLSNFMLWQMAYSEMLVTPKLWPDFTTLDLLESLQEYQRRERRYGGVGKSDSK